MSFKTKPKYPFKKPIKQTRGKPQHSSSHGLPKMRLSEATSSHFHLTCLPPLSEVKQLKSITCKCICLHGYSLRFGIIYFLKYLKNPGLQFYSERKWDKVIGAAVLRARQLRQRSTWRVWCDSEGPEVSSAASETTRSWWSPLPSS